MVVLGPPLAIGVVGGERHHLCAIVAVDVVDGLHEQALPTLVLAFEQVELHGAVAGDVAQQHPRLAVAEAVAVDGVESHHRLAHDGHGGCRRREQPHLARVGIERHILPETVATHIHRHRARHRLLVAQTLGAHLGEHHHGILHLAPLSDQVAKRAGVHDRVVGHGHGAWSHAVLAA